MTYRKPISRRAVLRGAGQIMVGLPFLEAMLPQLAWSAPMIPRMVTIFGGTPTYMKTLPPLGALGATLPPSMEAFLPVRQYISLLSNMSLPVYAKGTTPPPGGCVQQQHGCAPAPLLAGMTSYDAKPMFHECHTVDQVFADALGNSTKFKSIQARVQAAGYLYGSSKGNASSRFENGVSNALAPVVSPLELFTKLFSGGVGGSAPTTTVSNQVLNRRSVLDLVLGDANRLSNSVSAQDKIRLDQHFTEIRNIEKSLAAAPATVTVATGCQMPASPGADPAVVNPNTLGGWSQETIRGDLQAKIIAMALACDLTRAVSWMLTYEQCGLSSQFISGVTSDLHQISHDVNNDTTGVLQAAMQSHLNWHCARMTKLIQELLLLREGAGTVLDSTFIGMGFGEGNNAHNRRNMHMFIGGMPATFRMGQHIAGNLEHPARMWVAGLNGLGVTTNKLGQITGSMTAILK